MKILSLSYFLLYNTINSIIYLINKSICLDNKIFQFKRKIFLLFYLIIFCIFYIFDKTKFIEKKLIVKYK